MALPEIGLRAVIDNLSGFKAGADSINTAYFKINKGADSVALATAALGGNFAKLGSSILKVAGLAGAAGIGGLALGIGAVAKSGLEFNNTLEQATARINAFTKDGAQTAIIIEKIRKEAAATPFTFQDMTTAVASLLPASKQAGVAIEELITQAEVLAASNPAEGLEGAAFALREALSGDFTSIIERFNLPRKRINELKEQGVPALESIQTAMKEMGLDTDLVAQLAQTAQGRWSTFTDTLQNLAGTITQPIFDTFSGGLGSVNDLLAKSEPMLAAIANTIAGRLSDAIVFIGSRLTALFMAFQGGGISGVADLLGLTPQTVELANKITSSISSLGSTIMSVLMPAFTNLASGGILDAVNMGIEFVNQHFEEFKGALLGVGAVIAAGVFAALVAGIFSLLTPINLIIAGAALLGAAWAGNWGNIQGITASVWATLQPILTQLMTWLQTNIPIAIQYLSNLWTTTLLPALTVTGQFITGTLIPVWLQLQGVLLAIADVIGAVLGVAITAVAGYLQNIFLPAAMLVWTGLQDTFMPILTTIGNYLSSVLNPMLGENASAFGWISEKLGQATALFTGWAEAIKAFQLPPVLTPGSPTPLETALQGIATVLQGPLQGAFNAFAKVAQAPLKIVATLSTQIVTNFRDLVALIAIIVEVWEPATSAMIGNFQRLGAAGTVAGNAIKISFSSVGSLLNATSTSAASLSTNIRNIGTSAASSAASLISMSTIKFEGLIENMGEIESASESVQEAFADARATAQQFNSTSLSNMAGALNGINSTLQSIINNFESAGDAAGSSGLGGASVAGAMVAAPALSSSSSNSITNYNSFGGNSISSGMDEAQFDAMVLAALQRLSR
jgi:hypothetical protein